MAHAESGARPHGLGAWSSHVGAACSGSWRGGSDVQGGAPKKPRWPDDRPGKSPQATMVTDGVRDVVVLYLNRPDNFPTCRDRHRLCWWAQSLVGCTGNDQLSLGDRNVAGCGSARWSLREEKRRPCVQDRRRAVSDIGYGTQTHYPRDGTKQP